jgi:hypothetical protein
LLNSHTGSEERGESGVGFNGIWHGWFWIRKLKNLFYMFLTKEVIQDNLRYKYFVFMNYLEVPIRLSNLLDNVSKNKFDFKNFSLNKLLI